MLLPCLAACSEWGLGRRLSGGDGLAPPVVEVTPGALDFGALEGGEVASATVSVRNAGEPTSVLAVEGVRIEGPGAFSWVEEPGAFSLPSNETRSLGIVFAPATPAEHTGAIVVVSDDPDHPELRVPIVGNGLHPELQITPDPLVFGAVPVGCDAEAAVTLRNIGTWPLTLDAVVEEGEGMRLVETVVTPLTLARGGEQVLHVRFSPTRAGTFTGALRVRSDEPDGERTAAQIGEGVVPLERVDAFDLPVDPPADLLFFVDQSWSMRDDQVALGANFDAFIDRMDTGTPNWRLLVANSDNACTELGVIDRATPAYASVFRTAVQTGGGSRTESGLMVVADALEQTGPGACNEGFLRDDALLHVVFVTDESDQSPGAWEDYLARMQAVKADPTLFRASAVAGPLPDGCTTLTNDAQPGRRYSDVVAATEGVFLSICDAWSDSVTLLADASIRRDVFGLTAPADPASVRVERNGMTATLGWRYDPERNAVVFEPALAPREGEHVEVRYTEALTCPE